jgi:uncharacterized membrane protein
MLAVRLYDAIVSLHVIAIVLAFGVTFAYSIIVPHFARNNPGGLATLHEAQHVVGSRLIMPSMVVALITGLYLAADADVFGEVWVQVPMTILLILFALGGAFFTPTEKRMAAAARTDPAGAEYQALTARMIKVAVAADVLILVAIFFMVAKPGA